MSVQSVTTVIFSSEKETRNIKSQLYYTNIFQLIRQTIVTTFYKATQLSLGIYINDIACIRYKHGVAQKRQVTKKLYEENVQFTLWNNSIVVLGVYIMSLLCLSSA